MHVSAQTPLDDAPAAYCPVSELYPAVTVAGLLLLENWARKWGGRIGDRIEFTVSGRPDSVRDAKVTTSEQANTYIYTLMTVTHPGTAVRVCLEPAAKTGAAAGKRECFDGRVH